MTHYLRRLGKTVVDVEAGGDDLHCVVVIDQYSYLLLQVDKAMVSQTDIILDFHDLQEMRGEWHEAPEQEETPDEFVERKLKAVAAKYDLQYVTD